MIRRVEPADEPVVRRLQTLLREPSPQLLGHAVRTRAAYVSTVTEESMPTAADDGSVSTADDESVSTATDADEPVADESISTATDADEPVADESISTVTNEPTVTDASLGLGRPVGYLLPVTGREVHVAELVVAPEYRRAGRGRRLLRRVLADADGRVTLFVHPDNDAARSLYDSVGFRQIDRRIGFYDDADALVLAHSGESVDTA